MRTAYVYFLVLDYLLKMGFSDWTRTFLFLNWVLIFIVPCLDCFQFIEVIRNPFNVVIGHNSTNLKLRWEFDLDVSDHFNGLVIYRYKDGLFDQTKVEMAKYYSSGFVSVRNDTLYALNASGVSPRGFASFSIKNILLQDPNGDGTTFDPLESDVTYVYRIDVTIPNLDPSVRSDTIKLQVKVLPESTSIIISPDQTSFCLGSNVTISCSSYAKPPAKYSLYHNTKLVSDNSTSGVFDVTLNDEGKNNYTCVPYNTVGFGQNRSLPELFVKEPPKVNGCQVISNSMINGAVAEGENVTLMCNFYGSEPLNITWTDHNGVKKWNQPKLVFTPVKRENAGSYSVTVNNGKECDQAEWNNLPLVVYFKPESTSISISPDKTDFCLGSNVTISCTSYAKPPANYSLYHNTKLVLDDSTSGVFHVTLNDVGENTYTCLSNNAVGDGQNRSRKLLVKEPPKVDGCQVISNNKVNKQAIEGENVTLMCNFYGSEPLNITWTDHNGVKEWNQPKLVFTPVNRVDAGNYSVTVNNGKECDQAEWKNLPLIVYFKPESTSINISPPQTSFCLGSNVTINCTSYAKPPAKYSLYHNTNLVRNDSTSGVFHVTLNDVGENTYTCLSNNAVGDGQNQSQKLLVKESPKVGGCQVENKNKVNKPAIEGENVTLMCNFFGTEPLNIAWTDHNGVKKGNQPKLMFTPVKRENAGSYSVTVNNGKECDQAEWNNLPLVVYYPSKIDNLRCQGCKDENSGTVVEGKNISLFCNASGNPKPNITWIKDGAPRGIGNSLSLPSISRGARGKYTCIADNGIVKQDNKTLEVIVHYKPDAPVINHSPTKASFCLGIFINITCTANASPPVEKYILFRNNGFTQENKNGLFEVWLNTTGEYRFTCKPKNMIGVGKNQSLSPSIYVKEPPKISNCQILENGKEKAIAVEGRNVIMTCNISGSEPLNSTWRNKQKVWNSSKVTFQRVNRNDDGIYSLTVSNGDECKIAETSLKLIVNYVPESTTMEIIPGKTKFCRGDQIHANCSTKAKPQANYSMYQNDKWIISSRTGNAFVHLNVSGNISFTCVPDNEVGYGENSSTALEVKEPPKIRNCQVLENGTEKRYAVEGRNVALRCDISGTEPLNSRWTKGQQVWNDSLVPFRQVNRNDNGTYKLTVNNGEECNKAKKSFDFLVYYKPDKPRISHSPNRTKFCFGSFININCESGADPPIKKYYLYRNEELHKTNSNGVFNVRLDIKGMSTFACKAENQIGFGESASLTDPISVTEPPRIGNCKIYEVEEGNIFTKEGRNVTLRCNISGSEPLNSKWANGLRKWNDSTVPFQPVSRNDNGTYKLTVNNGEECNKTENNFDLHVYYFDEPDICKNNISFNGSHYAFNITGYPKPNFTCRYETKLLQIDLGNGKWFYNMTLSNETEQDCAIGNTAGNCSFMVYKAIPGKDKDYSFIIINKEHNEESRDEDLRTTIAEIIRDIYREKLYFKEVKIIRLRRGSVIVDFQLVVVAVAADYLEPLRKAVIENSTMLRGFIIDQNSIQNGFYKQKTTPIPTTTAKASDGDTPTPPDDNPTVIIIVVIVVVVVVIVILVLIFCYCKKKRGNGKDSSLANAVEIHDVEEQGTNNQGFSPSHYADKGPSHVEPAYDSVERRPNDAKDKNDNQTQPGMEQEEPAYAAVDKFKKTNKGKTGELLYAELEEFQKDGNKAAGGHDGIAVETLPKGKDIKMPKKYEETIYADIDHMRKPAGGANLNQNQNQNAGATSTDIPLADLHGKGSESDEGAQKVDSGQTADPAKQQNEQKPASGATDKPPDTQEGQPPTKEDSGKEESDSAENSVTKFDTFELESSC